MGPSQNPPKTFPKPFQSEHGARKIPKNRFYTNFSIFFRFLEPPGPPKIEATLLQSAKKLLKVDVKKNMLLSTIFYQFFFALAPPNGIKIQLFSDSFRKHRFGENHYKNIGCAHKNQGSNSKKNKKITNKSIPKRTRKK